MATRKAVLASLTLLSRTFAGEVSPEKVDVYIAALEDLPDEQLKTATARVIREHEGPFIPPPAILRSAAGLNAAARLDVRRVIREIQDLGEFTGHGFVAPSIPRVHTAFGPLISGAYGAADADRLFSETPTTREIARRDFARYLEDGIQTWGLQKLPSWALVPLPPAPAGLKLLAGGKPGVGR